ncbi:MAG: PA2779 family protein [Betaproteobacteria bacterium]|nr:PA2779 family protein [Betaproteobacteria bacterium]
MSATRMICRLLIVAMAMLPFQTVQAGMIGTDQVVSVANANLDRAAILSVINRAEVADQLQAIGLDLKTANDRVAAMTDVEIRSLAGQLDTLPAGAKTSGWAVVIVILLGLWIYSVWK